MKKKIIAIGLITSMVICNSMTVWAADKWDTTNGYVKNDDGNETTSADVVSGGYDETPNDTGEKNVKATFSLGNVPDVYSVDITWGAMTFTPNTTLSGSWNIAGYYNISNFDKWVESSPGASNITVKNNSSKYVYVYFDGQVDDYYKDTYMKDEDKDDAYIDIIKGEREFEESTWLYLNALNQEVTDKVCEDTVTVDVKAQLQKSPKKVITSEDNMTLGTVTVKVSEEGPQ